jgi:hypothetical protein
MTFCIIDLTPVFTYIIAGLAYVFDFCTSVLTFHIGDYTFNMLTFCVGAYSLGMAINALFGSPVSSNTVYTYDDWEDI